MSCYRCKEKRKFDAGDMGFAHAEAQIRNRSLHVWNKLPGRREVQECYIEINICPWCGEKL